MDFWYVFVLLHALNSCTHLVVVLSEEQIKECQELGVLVDRDDQGCCSKSSPSQRLHCMLHVELQKEHLAKKLQKEQFQVFNTQLLTGCMHTSYFLHVYRKVCNMRFCWTGTPFMDCDNSKRELKGGVQSDK